MRRLRSVDRPDRLIAAVFGAWFLYTSVWLWLLWSEPDPDAVDVFYTWLWPWVFAAAGLMGLVHAGFPSSRRIAAWSGGLMLAALLSRSFTILAAWLAGNEDSAPRSFLGAGVWLILAYSVGLIWTRLIYPIGASRRRST